MAAIPAPGPEIRPGWRDTWERLRDSPRAREVAIFVGLILFAFVWGAAVAYAAVGATLLVFSFIACIACLRDFRVGVAILILIMPISQSTIFPHAMFGMTGLNPLNLLIVATFIMFFMRAAGTPALKGFIPRPLFWLYIIPLIAATIVGIDHVREIPRIFKATEMLGFDTPFGYVRDILLKPLGLVVYACLVGAAVAWSQRPEKFVIPMLVSVFVMAVVGVGFVASLGVSISQLSGVYSRHIMSTIGMHANDLGRLYAVAFALLLFVWDRTHRLGLKALLVIAMVSVAAALFLTFSRGAFFGFVVVCILYFILRRTLKTLLIILTLVIPGLLFAPGALWSRLETGFGMGINEITAGRYDEIWMPLMPVLAKVPPWGDGLASILWSHPMRMEEMFFVAHPHNMYMQVYMDMGIIGTVLVIWFWMISLRGFWRLSGDERLVPEMQGFFEGAAVGLVAFFIAGIAGSSLFPTPEQCYLWLALGMMWGVKKHLARLPVPEPKPKAPPEPPPPTYNPRPFGAS